MMKRMLFLIFILTGVYSYLAACDMSAMIVRDGCSLSSVIHAPDNNEYNNYNDPRDYLAFVMSRSNSTTDNDGYGILYYEDGNYRLNDDNVFYKYLNNGNQINHVFYTGNYFNPLNEPDVFDDAMEQIMDGDADAKIVMCHARNSSSSPFAPGNHPFRLNYGNRTFSFMHNGGISQNVRTFMINETNLLSNTWFATHSPNFPNFPSSDSPAYWIDSEVIFHYLVAHIIANNGNVLAGLQISLKKIEQYIKLSTNTVNFVFSDGQNLYAFRSTPLNGMNSGYKLCYKYVGTKFYGVRTGTPTPGETEVRQFEMVVLHSNDKPDNYPEFLKNAYMNRPQSYIEPIVPLFRSISIAPVHNTFDISISFFLGEPTRVKLNIYNQKGQLIRRLADKNLAAGAHKISWDGLDNSGRQSARGIYFIEAVNGTQKTVNKVIYTK
jgi:hypothetical protein